MKINQKAFTLVEIMVVVLILAILAAIAIPNLLRARITANESAAKATLKSISTALENYYSINSQYPLTTSPLIGDVPPYLSTDFFVGDHQGYNFSAALSLYTYSVIAVPVSASSGTASYSINTQGVLSQN
jgi:prepilin-type N-terminal cleavage/methylation domain-containing protein